MPQGYQVQVVLKDLIYPSSIEMDEQGNLYVAEAGYAYGDLAAPARVHRLSAAGKLDLIADQLSGPVNDLLWFKGKLYISHRGKISVVDGPMKVIDLVKRSVRSDLLTKLCASSIAKSSVSAMCWINPA